MPSLQVTTNNYLHVSPCSSNFHSGKPDTTKQSQHRGHSSKSKVPSMHHSKRTDRMEAGIEVEGGVGREEREPLPPLQLDKEVEGAVVVSVRHQPSPANPHVHLGGREGGREG